MSSVRLLLVWALVGCVALHTAAATAQDNSNTAPGNEAALAQYADAANFQTNGELELAIEQWQAFLEKFPGDALAPKAAHYLGVCYMQLAEPRLAEAAEAFERALALADQSDAAYELREETLANLGWCQYALGSDPAGTRAELLRKSIETYSRLLKTNPNSRFADRAIFYTGEAHYVLGDQRQAIAAYDRLLTSKAGENSALQCDARYAKGVALEDLKEYDAAAAAFREMLRLCGDDPLATDARLHLAEVLVMQQKYAEAEKEFAQVIAADGAEKPQAIYRRAYVLVQMNRADEAARLYEVLVQEHPESPYAASALLAAAQSHYRAGQMDQAAARFEQVLEAQTDLASATEAAHWLSVIAMREGNVERAEQIARAQIARGLEGAYKTLVRLDAAEARSLQPGKQAEALAEFEQMLADSADDPLLPRILYNAAFTAFQASQPQKSLQWAARFQQEFPEDPLAADMRYIAAESHLLAGNAEAAAAEYRTLLAAAEADNPQLALWVLRGAAAMIAAGARDEAIELLGQHAERLGAPPQRAEVQFLVGTAHLGAGRHAEAISAFEQALAADPQWPRSAEVRFRLAAAHQAAGDVEQAVRVWREMIDTYAGTPTADQARYRLAQHLADQGQLDEAISLYDQLLEDEGAALRPFALYGRGWALLQRKDFQPALEALTSFLDQYDQHPLRDDALLARGITYRRLGQEEAAATDLQAFLAMGPSGDALGHGLYELAMSQRKSGRPQQAVALLRRLLDEVPDYPATDAVQYELAWALKDAGQSDEALRTFSKLATDHAESPHAAEAHYYVGQQHYANKSYAEAAGAYDKAAELASADDLREKALYRLGWSHFHNKNLDEAAAAFTDQITSIPDGRLTIDGMMMVGECKFTAGEYADALAAYERARELILEVDGENRQFGDPTEQRVRELVFLHGGQSAAQLERWDEALRWYEQLRTRYPSSSYLSQVFYETGFAHQQKGNDPEALKFYAQTADTFRDESAARARFMMGEIFFKQNKPTEAITEFKRVMYGFGADKAPEAIHDWQAKSGFEAGRCAELLVQVNQGERRRQAIELAKRYYQYVTEQHAEHALASKARDRLEVLDRL